MAPLRCKSIGRRALHWRQDSSAWRCLYCTLAAGQAARAFGAVLPTGYKDGHWQCCQAEEYWRVDGTFYNSNRAAPGVTRRCITKFSGQSPDELEHCAHSLAALSTGHWQLQIARAFGGRAVHWRLALAAGQHRLAVPSGMGSIGVSTAPFTIQIVRRLGLLVVASPSSVASHPTNLNTARIRLRP